ncbi:SDR family oxidoreductase [Lentisalinibacter sediminis]|uniref:SDR family oxidoreductase n=1 Tax=Lentisalinibacter sediminis TaxID=2992237 RepID=UPI00386DB13C
MPRNIFVTGAAGYIGGLTVAELAGHDDVGTVVAYDIREAEAPAGVVTVSGDIASEEIAPLLEEYGIDTVIHLASILKPPPDAPPDLARRVDVIGTRRLLEACVEAGVGRFVVTTSGAAYGYSPDNPRWMTEEAPARGHPAFEYSRNKSEVERILVEYRITHPALAQVLLRPGTVIGKGTSSPVTEIFEGPVVPGILGTDAPFVFVWDRDLVAILVQAALGEQTGVYNVAGDGALTARAIAKALRKPYLPVPAGLLAAGLGLAKRLGKTVNGPETVDFLRYRPVLSNERLKSEFGYTPISSAAAFRIWLEDRDEPDDKSLAGDADYRPVVAITGGAGGIGRALARRWSLEGARIALLDFEPEPLEQAAEGLRVTGADVMTVGCDVTDYAACQRAFRAVVGHYGRLDVLMNNAGTVHRSLFEETDLEVYRKVMEVNFFGSVNCTKAALEYLRATKGLIIVTSSIAGVAPLYGRTGYAASKHALHGFFESLRCEVAADGVRVMVACPNFVRSPFEQRAMGGDGKPAGTRRTMIGRLAEPDDVADAMVRGAKKGRDIVVLSFLGRLSYYMARLTPRLYARGMTRRLREKR